WVHDLWVDDSFRNQGAGREMTARTISRFKELGVRQVRLQTASANEAGRRMFASCGFRPATVEMLVSIHDD
ncbi:MAG: GNAT family N-acetyltransferase, partial [Burkholderiales bacterium]|nr:GNAT family N-acetyltransferase [Phycisphaerae bacterium]